MRWASIVLPLVGCIIAECVEGLDTLSGIFLERPEINIDPVDCPSNFSLRLDFDHPYDGAIVGTYGFCAWQSCPSFHTSNIPLLTAIVGTRVPVRISVLFADEDRPSFDRIKVNAP